MQRTKNLNITNFVQHNEQLLFYVSSLISIVLVWLGIYFENKFLFLVPFGFVLIGVAILNFRALIYLLLLILPISVEMELGTLGLDVPSEPIVILLAVCVLFYLLKNYTLLYSKTFKHPIIWAITALFIWSCISTIYSQNIVLSIKYLLAKAWYILGFLIAPMLIINTKKQFRYLFWCLFIPTFLSVLYILLFHAIEKFSFDSITNVVHPIYRNHVNYAVFITMLLPFIFLATTWYPKSSFKNKFLKMAILIFFVAIYFSYTRGAWLAMVAMILYYFVMKLNATKYILSISIFFVFVFSIYILKDNNYLKYAPNYDTTIYHEELGEHLSSTFEMEDMSTVERFYRWIAAVHLFKEHPIVGVGPNNFVSNYKPHTVTAFETYISENEERSTVHNYFLLLLTEQGFPGMLLFILFIGITLLSIQKMYHVATEEKKKYIVALTLCLIAFLLNNTLSDLVEANKVGSLFYICLALLINTSELDFES